MVKKITKKINKKLNQIKLFQAKVTTLFFGFLGLFTLLFIGYFLYFQISEAKDVDEILPAENLIFFGEFSTIEFADLIEQNADLKTFFLEPLMQQYLNQDLAQFNAQASKWLGSKMAFAVYSQKSEQATKQYYFFLENDSQKKALEFLHNLGVQGEELTQEKYQKSEIFSFSQSLNLSCSFFYGYLVCSNEAKALKDLIDLNQKENGFLNEFSDYNKVKNNLPKMAGGKIYFDLQEIDFQGYELLLGPIQEYLRKGGVSFTQLNQGIRLNTYLSFEKGLVSTGAVVTKNDLDRYVSAENLGMYLGGTNLTGSFQQILTIWNEFSPYFNLILEGMLRARVAEYFGTEVSLENDLYELFKNGYALEVKFLPLPQFKVILEAKDSETAKTILEKMFEGVYLKNEKYKLEEKQTVLQDDVVVTELIADDAKVQKQETEFAGTVIHSIEIENVPLTFAYALKDDKIFMGTSQESVREILDLIQNSHKSLAQAENYLQMKESLFLAGEEVSYFDLQKLTQFLIILGVELPEIQFLQSFDYATFSTKWFDDGMASEAIFLKTAQLPVGR